MSTEDAADDLSEVMAKHLNEGARENAQRVTNDLIDMLADGEGTEMADGKPKGAATANIPLRKVGKDPVIATMTTQGVSAEEAANGLGQAAKLLDKDK